ncbi:MAG: 1-(5-phosphoribosyl)-5-[(5-phosphoribosylamino)methylideneamino]imidazole-4-carboxamide isomerase [Candidatus Neomarinimicrobiota bacterium]|nr:MAG: 1-(5-phosphoribosyl)-5-[(5-phosphoribosylamino)methylideneamino]imidazole-4-carboxamide isomerase [Candidatus Neomarinimicrobiota bacterium]
MKLIPAIDISQGKCVRLTRGKITAKKIYDTDPVAVAERLRAWGVDLVHVVDLDSAMGRGKNNVVIKKIIDETGISVQLGGGIRSVDDIEKWLKQGVARVVLGTVAVEDPRVVESAIKNFGGERIVVAIDVSEGYVCTHGWKRISKERPLDFAKRMEKLGASRFLYTDIAKDGTLSGIPFENLKEFGSSIPGKVIASGGVGGIKDLLKLKELERFNVGSVIVGKALYEGRIDIQMAKRVLEE